MGGGDMANVKNSNLKVPPLKIVLSSATSGGSDRSTSSSPSSESESLDSNLTIISENQQQQERINKSGEQSQSQPQQQPQSKDDSAQGKLDKLARQAARSGSNASSSSSSGSSGGASSADQKSMSNSVTVVPGNRRSQDKDSEATSSNNNSDSTASREQSTSSSSNQRITRSSQRAAQQNKSESETNGDETNVIEAHDTTNTSSGTSRSTSEPGQRKVKRRKGEIQESEQDNNQQVPPQPVMMANICPADYQLPSQNSFELYRDIRNRPYTKMMKLNLVQPRMPQGFKDYLLHSGPYLLDGNKVGAGLSGSKSIESSILADAQQRTSRTSNCVSNKTELSAVNHHQQQHASYKIPKLLDTPRHLKVGSPLCELFQDQEKARQKMRIQHLKERERSVLSAEQEILRAYNRFAITDTKQPSHLSACTYFYYQERYHYIDEKNNYLDSINQKDSSQSRENSDSCNSESNTTERLQAKGDAAIDQSSDKSSPTSEPERASVKTSLDGLVKVEKGSPNPTDQRAQGNNGTADHSSRAPAKKRKGEPDGNDPKETNVNGSKNGCDKDMDNNETAITSSDPNLDGDTKVAIETTNDSDDKTSSSKGSRSEDSSDDKRHGQDSSDKNSNAESNGEQTISGAELKDINKANLINNLHDIDEKWAKIREEMFVRHKNESDSLYAVQCLEWEWKAKEIGACDVRLSPRIDSESVPRVVVSTLDY